MNSQIPFSRIAMKLNISPETVRQRYQKMVDNKSISINSISIDLSKLGFEKSIFLFVKGKPNRSRVEVLESLKKLPNIFTITELTGKFDFYLSGVVKDLQNFYDLVDSVNNISFIDRVEFMLAKELSLAHSKVEKR